MSEAAFVIPGDITLPTGGYAYDRRVIAHLMRHGISANHITLPGSYPNPPAGDLESTEATLAAIPASTVLLIDGLAYGAMPASLIDRLPHPIVALCHHPLCLEEGTPPARAAELKALETAALARARHVIVSGPMTARILAQDFAVAPDKITVAEPGTDPAERAVGTGQPLALLAVGSIIPRKAYPVLIDALEGLRDLDWRLTIAGAERDAGAKADLDAAIARTGLGARVQRLGSVDNSTLGQLYRAADVFVMPSLFEGYGMVLAEAMARGLPIVCTTGGAAADTAPDAAALKVPPGDSGAFRSALRRLLTDAPLRRGMSEASWSAGQTLPQWSDTARIIADVLRRFAP